MQKRRRHPSCCMAAGRGRKSRLTGKSEKWLPRFTVFAVRIGQFHDHPTRPFLAGVACLTAFLLLPHPPKVLYALGWFGMLGAYFLWLRQTYQREAPLWTRGGRVI